MQLEDKQTFTKNWGLLAKLQKGVFLVCFGFFLWFCFLFSLCFVRLFCNKGPKRLFPAILEVFVDVFPPKGLSLKSLFSSYSVFLFVFLLSSLSKFHFFFAFCPSTLFLENIINFWFLLFLIFLSFPFLMFACFFETNFPNIPFLKPKLLSFLVVFSSVILVFVFMVRVSAFLLLCWFCFGQFSCLVVFCFCLVSCFASIYEQNTVFPAILVFFELSWLKGSLLFTCFLLLLLFCFLCCLFAV